MNTIDLPTGKLFVHTYSKGELETLSIGDYGKSKNIKADFLGYTRELNGVANGDILPLQEKWVITVSTQYGCTMNCTFCDVPSINYKGNATVFDLQEQLYSAIRMYPNVKYTDRLNLHYARMGEPAHNAEAVLAFSKFIVGNKDVIFEDTGLRIETLHPVFTTSCPKNVDLKTILNKWCDIKNKDYNGQAGLQLSINSTNEEQRNEMFGNKSLSLKQISDIAKTLPNPLGRKYTLNFAYSTDYEIDGDKLAELFDPKFWMVKITPIHNNNACVKNGVETVDGYHSFTPYREPEESCKKAGFDVLIFVPSQDEEDGAVTCGNAIVAGSKINLKS